MAHVLVVDDEPVIAGLLATIVTQLGHSAVTAGSLAEVREILEHQPQDVVLLDLELPDGNGLSALDEILAAPGKPEVIIITGTGDANGAETAFASGAWDYVPKPFRHDEVALPLARALQYREERQAATEPQVLDRAGIVGNSPPLMACLGQLAYAARSEAGVLVSGETGTGKELFARAIHANSPRREGNFVTVDCAALPESLVESTLFGHERGAFTGADRGHLGLIGQADGGTLFLDEVGELPLSMQRSFLRVLQEHRFRPLGGEKELNSDFRLLAATNRDLDAMAAQGRFRQELLYRLRAVSIHLPPLRERPEDIKDLTLYYLGRFAKHYHADVKGFSPEFLQTLMKHQWPGNVRELVNTLEGALAAAGDHPILHCKHLPPRIRVDAIAEPAFAPGEAESTVEADIQEPLPPLREYRSQMLARAESSYLERLMASTRGDIKKACAVSGLSPSRLHALLKQYNTPRHRGGR